MNYLDNDFKKKYFKYKNKYLNYKKNTLGGNPLFGEVDEDGFICVKKSSKKSSKKKLEQNEERLISINDIKCNIEFINLFNEYKPLSVIVYGSTARGTNKLTSDIDFMIIWRKISDLPNDEELLIIKDTIINIFKKPIDFVSMVLDKKEVCEEDKNYNYMHNVCAEGVVVYGDTLKCNILLSRKVKRT
jgi:predicted nucleotidyltransferase